MKATLTADFNFYVNGITPTVFAAGTVVEDDVARCAVQVGAAVEVSEAKVQGEQTTTVTAAAPPPAAPTRRKKVLS